jgi:hypothetical protein
MTSQTPVSAAVILAGVLAIGSTELAATASGSGPEEWP